MVTVADVDGAGTGDEVFARVLVSAGRGKSTQWSEWQLLGHTNCADLSVSKTEYFDEFSDITDPWLAVAVYNCGDDDVVIDTIGVWQGDGVDDLEIDYFCPNLAGPSNTCAEDATSGAIGTCGKFSDMEPYDYFRLDQDTCGAFAFETDSMSTSGWPIATAYVTDDPGIPSCTVTMQENKNQRLLGEAGLFTETSMNMLDAGQAMVAIPAAAVLTGALAYFMCLRKSVKKDTEYSQLTDYGTN